eukprot:Gb_21261 [translate_table: standard]
MAENASNERPDWRTAYGVSQRKALVECLQKRYLKHLVDPKTVRKLAAMYMEELAFRTYDNQVDYADWICNIMQYKGGFFEHLLDKNVRETFRDMVTVSPKKQEDEEKFMEDRQINQEELQVYLSNTWDSKLRSWFSLCSSFHEQPGTEILKLELPFFNPVLHSGACQILAQGFLEFDASPSITRVATILINTMGFLEFNAPSLAPRDLDFCSYGENNVFTTWRTALYVLRIRYSSYAFSYYGMELDSTTFQTDINILLFSILVICHKVLTYAAFLSYRRSTTVYAIFFYPSLSGWIDACAHDHFFPDACQSVAF